MTVEGAKQKNLNKNLLVGVSGHTIIPFAIWRLDSKEILGRMLSQRTLCVNFTNGTSADNVCGANRMQRGRGLWFNERQLKKKLRATRHDNDNFQEECQWIILSPCSLKNILSLTGKTWCYNFVVASFCCDQSWGWHASPSFNLDTYINQSPTLQQFSSPEHPDVHSDFSTHAYSHGDNTWNIYAIK